MLEIRGQSKEVTGVVYDGDTETTMPSVTVVIKGTTAGTITDIDGKFNLKVDPDAVLVFSFIGYQSQEVPVANNMEMAIHLQPEVSDLDEVVVVGYGKQKKSDLTGSVSIVDMKQTKKSANSNVGTMLQGKVSGVRITSDGQAGADPTIRIRGVSTFGDSSPLYVIDGVPVGTSIRDFSPSDFESVQVLKDASAAAIYGSRAANGVIIITTKKGRKDTPMKVSYKGYYGVDNIYQHIPVLHRADYQSMYNESLENNGSSIMSANDPDSDDYIDNVDTDWQDAGFKTGTRQDHNISLTGGGKNNTYGLVFDLFSNKGTMEGSGPDYDRYSVRANNTLERGIFKLNTSFVYTHTKQNTLNVTSNGGFSGSNPPMVVKLLSLIPTMKVYDSTTSTGYGTYDPDTQGEDYSLNIVGVNNLLEDQTFVDLMLANASAELNLGELFKLRNQKLVYKLNLSYDKTVCKDKRFIPEFSFSTFYTNEDATLDEGARYYTTGLVENTLNYTLDLGENSFDLLVGQMYQHDNYYTITGHGEGFSEPYYKYLSNAESYSTYSYENEHYIASYLGRLNYKYGDKYLVTATLRRDGSSRFSESNRLGYFPSVAVGWKLNKESFFPISDDIVSEFKFRASYGVLGNENIDNYLYLSTVNRNNVYSFDGTVVTGSGEDSLLPSDLKWETKKMTNIGLDMSFFNKAIDFSVEYYSSKSSDLLVDVTIPYSNGSVDTAPTVNAGAMKNYGMEFNLGYHNLGHEFKYNIGLNATTMHNKVLELSEADTPIYGTASITQTGKEVGRHFGYVYDGIFQNQDEIDNSAYQTASTAPGDIKFKDLNGDGTIDTDDRTDLGSALPSLNYGISFSANYKNFDISLFANGSTGYKIKSNLYGTLMHTGGGLNWHKDILNAWTHEGQDTDIPRVVYEDPNDNGRDSNRPGWLQDGTFLRFSNVSLGYNVPEDMLKGYLSSARVYVTCQNICTLTKYKGFNPDFSTSDVWSPGYNSGSYPLPRTIMVGVNLDF